MAYQRHDKDNQPVTTINTYVRHDKDCAVASTQPGYVEKTDSYGNTYRDYNADYVSN